MNRMAKVTIAALAAAALAAPVAQADVGRPADVKRVRPSSAGWTALQPGTSSWNGIGVRPAPLASSDAVRPDPWASSDGRLAAIRPAPWASRDGRLTAIRPAPWASRDASVAL